MSDYIMPSLNTSQDDLVKIASDWEKESSKYKEELEKIQEQNSQYYQGNQTEKDRIPTDMSNAVQNHVFMGVETVVPILTANSPQFIVEPPEESDVAIRYAQALQKALAIQYENLDVRSTGETVMRHMIIYRFGAWKYYWKDGEIAHKFVKPDRLYFPRLPFLLYMMEKVDIATDEFKELFGEDKYNKFLKSKKEYSELDEEKLEKVKGVWTIWEIWTKDMVFWKADGHIIDKKENPNYNFKDKESNYFDKPKIPYIVASAFRLGDSIVGNTDLIQQTIGIQDIINVTNRQIVNNANKTGNAQWFIDSSVMSEEEARNKITNTPGLIVYGDGVANQNLVRRDPPPPLPNYIPETKVMAERAFDNIFGTHSTTRGERGETETLGGRLLLKQADLGRIDLLVREYERVIAELGRGFVQLMKMNYKDVRRFRVYGEAGSDFVELSGEMISKGMKTIIKSGTTLPTDEMSKRNEALQLWGMGAIDPVTLFERLKFPNPQDTAEKLQAWRTGQLQQEAQITGKANAGINLGGFANQGRQTKALPSGNQAIQKANNQQ